MAVEPGGETETKEEDKRSGGPIVELKPDFKTIRIWSKIQRTFIG